MREDNRHCFLWGSRLSKLESTPRYLSETNRHAQALRAERLVEVHEPHSGPFRQLRVLSLGAGAGCCKHLPPALQRPRGYGRSLCCCIPYVVTTVTRLPYIQPLRLSAGFKSSVKHFYIEIKIQSGVGAKQQKNRHSDFLTHDGFLKPGNTNIQLTCETQSQKEAL